MADVVCSLLLCLLTLAVLNAKTAPFPVLIVFGDSLVDVGNNIYLNATVRADFPPYGRDYFHRPTGRFSNGRNSVDFIAQYLGIPFPLPSLNSSYNLSVGINFASGGSGIYDNTRASSRVMNLRAQLQEFHRVRKNHGLSPLHFQKTLFVISSGGNDLFEYIGNPSPTNGSEYVRGMAARIRDAVLELYHAGARKIVVYGIGPIGCVPAVVAVAHSHCFEAGNELALEFNNLTLHWLRDLSSKRHGLNVVFTLVYDLVSALTLSRDNIYGYKQLEKACCGGGRLNAQASCGRKSSQFTMHVCSNTSEYFFWDEVHPTENADELLVRMEWEGDNTFSTPFNISTLASL